jgi:5-methyltetrahydrofolate--homocysteine methyltransferase
MANMTAFSEAWHEVARGTGAVATVSVSISPNETPERQVKASLLLSALETVCDEGILRIGVTCSVGPDQGLRAILDRLSQSSPELHFAPSAGLPNDNGTYPWEAEQWAESIAELIDGMPVSTVGGCCGVTPGYIAALAERISTR